MNEGIGIEYASLPDKYILIAEDDEDDVSLLRSFFDDLPDAPEMLVINKGDKVISFFENLPGNHLPLLVLLDYNLPSVSGYEILIALADDKKLLAVPKIIWSTSNSNHFETQCLAKGAFAYFVKPSNIHGFQTLVQKLQGILSNSK
ncbi:MAG TPA: response regulator [Candidatus Paceibacterota bacterium]|jgi:CheY-like chemotaxis protein|nr:response regulator [Candidatus Paceibacterota bacterium]